jgi:metal-sulfur cluster biosynthetic enzyme
MNETPEALINRNELLKKEATKRIEAKLNFLEEEIKVRISKKEALLGLPTSVSAFVEKWKPKGIESVTRGSIYAEHNKKLKVRIEKACKQVKNPKIPSSIEDAYKSQIKSLEKQLVGLAEVNLDLHAKVEDLTKQIDDVVKDRDEEIDRLKELVAKSVKLEAVR